MDKKFYKMLDSVWKVIVAKMETDEELSKEINGILESYYAKEGTVTAPVKTQQPKRKSTKTKTPAVLNPLEVARSGEDELEKQLMNLDNGQLKDIIRDYDLDPLKLTTSWRKKEKIVGHIMEVVHVRINDGRGFRTN